MAEQSGGLDILVQQPEQPAPEQAQAQPEEQNSGSQPAAPAPAPRAKKGAITAKDMNEGPKSFFLRAPFAGQYRSVLFGDDHISTTPVPAEVEEELREQFGEAIETVEG